MREPVADQGRVRRRIGDAQSRAKLVLLPHRVLKPERRRPCVQRHDHADVGFCDPERIAPGVEIVAHVAQHRAALRVRHVEQLAVLALETIEPRIGRHDALARGLLGAEPQGHTSAQRGDGADESTTVGGVGSVVTHVPTTQSRPGCTARTG